MTNLDEFLQLAQSRRAVRHFRPDQLPDGVLEKLCDAARWAPSGYNLQPTHIVVVSDASLRQELYGACMEQKQILEAPVVAVFCGDRNVVANNFEATVETGRAAGAITAEYESKLRKFVPLAFRTGPLGVNWLWKAFLVPVARWFRPIPSIPAVHRRAWLAKQVALAAQNFMGAAQAAGLGTCPMEGFDSRRVAKVLGIPRHVEPILLVPVGFPQSTNLKKTRLPLERMVHRDGW
ncbi:MAG: nitroreductase family protein [Candidatus Sumerlaeaceae bacterium]|nr:nitroreductase family protein [Candidatus Sumerlaeaceae bacterium]